MGEEFIQWFSKQASFFPVECFLTCECRVVFFFIHSKQSYNPHGNCSFSCSVPLVSSWTAFPTIQCNQPRDVFQHLPSLGKRPEGLRKDWGSPMSLPKRRLRHPTSDPPQTSTAFPQLKYFFHLKHSS